MWELMIYAQKLVFIPEKEENYASVFLRSRKGGKLAKTVALIGLCSNNTAAWLHRPFIRLVRGLFSR